MLTRLDAVTLADDELSCLNTHISNLSNLCEHGGMVELRAGVEQLRAAVARIDNDVATARAARLQ